MKSRQPPRGTGGRLGLVPRLHFAWEPAYIEQDSANPDELPEVFRYIGPEDFPRYRGRIGRDPRVSQFCRRLLQTGAISRGDGGELKARVFVESRGVVLSALPHSDNNDFVDFPHVCDLSHSMHFSIV